MPLSVSTTGLVTQGISEIIEELAAAWQDPDDGFGPEADVSDSSTLGRISKVQAGREAPIQAAIQTLVLNFDPAVAEGYFLDVLARLNGVTRDPATYAESDAVAGVTSGATTIPANAIVRNDRTDAEWVVVSDVVAPGAGTYAVTIRARAKGPQDFISTDTWTIVTPSSGWTTLETTLDLAIEDAGTNAETNAELRLKREEALLAAGNDWDAIQAAVGLVVGVSYVGGLNNTTGGTLDGVPYGAIEVVVEGGDDVAVAQAIYDHLPPGTRTFGVSSETITMANGGPLEVYFTRPTPIDVWIRVTVSTTGAEYATRPSLETEIEDAVLEHAQTAFGYPGIDVISGALGGPLWTLSADTRTGRPTLTSIVVEISLDGASWQTTPLEFDHKERAVFEAAHVSVVGL
jgi:uncharacterized phage protein gp47/JayE